VRSLVWLAWLLVFALVTVGCSYALIGHAQELTDHNPSKPKAQLESEATLLLIGAVAFAAATLTSLIGLVERLVLRRKK